MGLTDRLDVYGDDPDFREGHPEDRCECGSPYIDHIPLRYALVAWFRHRWLR